MGRRQVPVKLIEDEKDRRKKYKKRMEWLKKKAKQFSTLCDVDACIISFGPSSFHALEVWPENDESCQVRRIVQRYLNHQPKERNQIKLDLPALLDKWKTKPEDQDQQQRPPYPSWSDALNSFSEEGLRNLARVLEAKVEVAKRKLEGFGQGPVQKRAKFQENQTLTSHSFLGDLMEDESVSTSCSGAMEGQTTSSSCSDCIENQLASIPSQFGLENTY